MTVSIGSRLDPVSIRQGLALSQERLGALLRISPKTVSRWKRAERRPTDKELLRKMAKLQEIVDLGARVYSPEGLKEFLSTPLPVFGGRSGLDLIGLGEFEPVLAALAADFEGTGF
ncbi:helix-turn-helix domain-containing protein [Acaryochloris sp. IP29b_bin.137]|uniref:helix-turn-helix domain-containing protein n=1 Tax=Acaryochloris sp. IP29b_bin.137 TaxID=2969217 RepID=UPI0026296CBA|nr:helix-turn-helix domain-containing protein [Acaryochloris sp. IP29b_bin.137]